MFYITKEVSLISRDEYGRELKLVEAICKSTDEKPTVYADNSLCLESDTGDLYSYDASTETWGKVGE